MTFLYIDKLWSLLRQLADSSSRTRILHSLVSTVCVTIVREGQGGRGAPSGAGLVG